MAINNPMDMTTPTDVWENTLMQRGILQDSEDGQKLSPVNMTIGREEVDKALHTLTQYKNDKSNLEKRIIENEQWYKSRHWAVMRNQYRQGDKMREIRPEPTSAWLFNAIMNKHADAMDNIPTLSVLPRESGDEYDAESLSNIIPVVLERCNWEDVYSDVQWYKLKNGTGCYGVFWDSTRENGIGDITVKEIDLLNVFWQAGIKDIQDSRNLFITTLVDNEVIKAQYPDLQGGKGKAISVAEYVHDDNVDTTDKTLVIDWYYKRVVGTKTVLHMAKIVGDELVYATENDELLHDIGLYEHGKYPIVFDTLFPDSASPVGFGFVDIMKSPQMYIDKIDQLVLENTLRTAKQRYFVRGDGAVSLEDFADLSKEMITVNSGDISASVQKVEQTELNMGILDYVQYKVNEMKETSGNTDVNAGFSSGGVTARSAISALQEAGNKGSRDIIKGSYRAFQKVGELVVELIRQFYDISRTFRIEGMDGVARYVMYNNANINTAQTMLPDGTMGGRKPVFDIKVQAERKNPFSTLSQNELAKELYSAGVFNPQLADQALMMLDMMEFEGKDKLVQKIQMNGQLYAMQQQMLMAQGMQMAQARQGGTVGSGENGSTIPADNGIAGAVRNATTNMAQRTAERAIAKVE